jgi:hypothetical protein
MSVILPACLFYVPIVRELLMFAGCVSDHAGHTAEIIAEQLRNGRNVACSLTGRRDVIHGKQGQVSLPPLELFRMVSETQNLYIVPVVVNDMRHKWPLQHVEWVRRLQAYFYDKIGDPWPCICWPRRGAPVHVTIGTPMLGKDYEGRATFMRDEFCASAEAIHNARLGEAGGDEWSWIE